MKLVVTFDQQGNILGLSPVVPVPPGGHPITQRPLEGQTIAELEVPPAFSGQSLLDLHNKLKVAQGALVPKG